MPTFRYVAHDAAGQLCDGQLEARTSIDAVNQLRRQGLRIERLLANDESAVANPQLAGAPQPPDQSAVDSVWHTIIEPSDSGSQADGEPSGQSSLGAEDLAALAGRIAQITKSQVPLTPGLRALSQELPSRSMRRGVEELCQRLERGETLEGALGDQSRAVPGHISGLIILGVKSGRLGEMMEWFLHHVRRQIDLRRRCRASLLYPTVLFACGVIAALGGLIWIVPDVVALNYVDGAEEPALVALLDIASQVVRTYGVFILCGILAIMAGVPLLLYLLGGRVLLHRCFAGIPFVGMMFRCSGLAAFCELLSMFITGHLPLAESIRLAARGTGDADLDERFEALAQCLERGGDETELFRRLTAISPQLVHVFQWKDRGRTFVDALRANARIYENQARLQITLSGILVEPLVVVGVLGGVGFFIAAMILPVLRSMMLLI
ncbi:MAG TPA: type II secretion system F family protein [Planctomycetaceae bacterium]|jgi:general secretion pathway protein F|nr:type II secretion system F family protein [Planctomycetaceae bacterium]